jgi:hypothetical protein
VKKTTVGGVDLPVIGHMGGSEKYSFQRAGIAKPAAAEKPLDLPKAKTDLVKGKIYNTARGPATWDGEKFVQ